MSAGCRVLTQNSVNRITLQTDSVRRTAEAADPKAPVYTVTKSSGRNGVNDISFAWTCGHPSSCHPSHMEARVSFDRYALAAP